MPEKINSCICLVYTIVTTVLSLFSLFSSHS